MLDIQNVSTVERELVTQFKVSGFYILLYPNPTYYVDWPFYMLGYHRGFIGNYTCSYQILVGGFGIKDRLALMPP